MQKALAPKPKYPEGSSAHVLPLPPFTRSYAVDVAVGLMVLFPSWLLHEVEGAAPTMDGYRISWAFNLAGDWHDTTDLHLELNATGWGSASTTSARTKEEL